MRTPEQIAHQIAGDWIMGPINMGDLEEKIAAAIHADRAALIADNAALRTALTQTVDALTAYFNKRGVDHAMRKGNEDIGDLADALSDSGPVLATDHPGAALLAAQADAAAVREERDGLVVDNAELLRIVNATYDSLTTTDNLFPLLCGWVEETINKPHPGAKLLDQFVGMRSEVERLRTQLQSAIAFIDDAGAVRSALEAMTTTAAEDPCQYDHEGYCQAHGLSRRPCRMEAARRVLGKEKNT